MTLDLILRNCRIAGRDSEVIMDIGFADGRIADIARAISADGPSQDVQGNLVLPGFVETHIHLDKSCILDRCNANASLADAITGVAALKKEFTEADVYDRAQRTLEKSILNGITHMRTHVEVDPRVGLRSFDALKKLKRDYAWAIDIELCVFPQEGLLNDPGTEELLIAACRDGADLIGGCPYTDTDPHGQISRIFSIAREFDSISTSISTSIWTRPGCTSMKYADRPAHTGMAGESPLVMPRSYRRSALPD